MVARTAGLAGALVLAAGAAAQGTAPGTTGGTTQGAARNWINTVALTDAGHRIGNPAAKVKLTEYVSYTCPHCAVFTREGEGALELGYVAPGKVTLEIHHMLRDPVDLVAAMLANCGPPSKFLMNHKAFLLGQDEWIAPLASASAAQRARWVAAGPAARRAIAADFHFYDLMERRGYSRVEADRCLADEALAKKLAAASEKDWKLPGVRGTPAFAIDGVVLTGTATWSGLQSQLSARF